MSFGAWSSIISRLVIPQDATENDPRVVIDPYDPFMDPDFEVAGILLYFAAGRAFGITVEDSGGTVGQLRIGTSTDHEGEIGFPQMIQIDKAADSYDITVGIDADFVDVWASELVVEGLISWGGPGVFAATTKVDADTATYNDVNSSGFSATSGAPEVTFFMPPSGRVRFDMAVRSDADNAGEQYDADVEVRLSNLNGAVVHAPSVTDAQGISHYYDPAYPASTNQTGWRYFEGTPGQAYWAQLQLDTGGTNMDINEQVLMVAPLL